MPELEQLDVGHAAALLDFELANRAYFAASMSDRGDDFFAHFSERLHARLAEQDAGEARYHVLVAEDGSILGRFNLLLRGDGVAELGFRVAEHATGRGLATRTVRQLCEAAPSRYDIRLVRAACSLRNAASRTVLTRAGFHPVGPADPADVGGKPGTWFELVLVKA